MRAKPINARRRLELRGEANGVTVYDDFAHHPTAILATLAALRGKVGGTARIIAVLEPRSNTMKMGICKDDLAPSLGRADEVFLLQPIFMVFERGSSTAIMRAVPPTLPRSAASVARIAVG